MNGTNKQANKKKKWNEIPLKLNIMEFANSEEKNLLYPLQTKMMIFALMRRFFFSSKFHLFDK